MQKRILAVCVVMTVVSVSNASEILSRIANLLAVAPNATRQINPADDPGPAELKRRGIDHQFRVEIESPKASLQVWVLDPRDESGKVITPEATVFMLHGIMANKKQLLSVGRQLQNEKCRVVLVDSRGHGRSTGKYLTYGVQESKDLTAILDFLTEKGLITGSVGVFGHSYGAATAIQWAGREPRVKAVATYAAFSSLRRVGMNYARKFLPCSRLYLTESNGQAIITETAKQAGFDADDASPVTQITHTTADILLIHGSDDRLIPPVHAKRLKKATNGSKNCKLVIIDKARHNPDSRVKPKIYALLKQWAANMIQKNKSQQKGTEQAKYSQ